MEDVEKIIQMYLLSNPLLKNFIDYTDYENQYHNNSIKVVRNVHIFFYYIIITVLKSLGMYIYFFIIS